MSAPKPPDPVQVANTQLGYNKKAQQANMIGQATPYGSLAWNVDPTQPGGFTATQTLSPAELQLLQQQQSLQTGAGTAAQGMQGQLAGLYGQPANLDPSAMTNQLMDWQTQYMQPYWNQQISNQTAALGNQGITPGSQAYNNAMMGLYSGIGNARNQFFAQAEPLAFSQALQQRELPLQEYGALQQMAGGPQQPNYVTTPTTQPPDYQTAAAQQYAAKQAQYGQMMQGLFGIPTALAGGWARGGFQTPSSWLR